MFGLPIETAYRPPTDEERDVIEAVLAAGGPALAAFVPLVQNARIRRFDDEGCLEFEPRGRTAVRTPEGVPFFEIAATQGGPWDTGPGGLYAVYVLVDDAGMLREIQFNFGLSGDGTRGGPTYGKVAQWVRERCGPVSRRALP